MAWGSSEKVDAKEIIGMTPDELSTRLGKIDALDAKVAEFSSRQAKDSENLTAILQRLEESAKPKPAAESADPNLDFLTDPTTAVDARLAPIQRQTAENTVMLQHRTARETYPLDFTRWGTEIVTKMGELSLAQQSDPRVWQAMVLMVRGLHAADLEENGAKGKFDYLEPVKAGLRPDPSTKDNLSSAEREMVRTLAPFGMTAEKYNRGKDRLEKARAARLGRFAEVS